MLSFRRAGREQSVALRPVDPGPASTLTARGPGAGTVSYFLGSEQYTGLAAYHELVYDELWPGVDLVFRGRGANLKYELHVAPGADPSRIRLTYDGAGDVSLGRRATC